MTARRRDAVWLFGLSAVLLLAAWVRVDNWQVVLSTGDLLPQFDGDSAYHLHRILTTIRQFPDVPTFDPLVNWPRGAWCPWSDGFDLGGAAFAMLFGGARSEETARIAAGLFPVVLGILLVWATMHLAMRLGGNRWAAIGAGLGVAILPSNAMQAMFGRIDHHVVEALIVVLLADWTLDLLPAHAAGGLRSRVAFEVRGALIAALGLYLFSGATLYVAIAAAVGLLALLAGPGRRSLVGSGAPGLAGAALLAAALTVPAISEHHRLISFEFPSFLQPALYAVAAAGLALAVAVTWIRPTSRWPARLALLAGAGVLLTAVTAVVFPQFAREVTGGIAGWMFHQDAWLKDVQEFQPTLKPRLGLMPVWATLHQSLGWAAFFSPLAFPLGIWWVARRDRERAWSFGFQCAVLVALTLVQTRFGRVTAPLFAIALAFSFALVAEIATQRVPRLAPAAIPASVAVLAAMFALDPPTRALLTPAPPAGLDPYQSAANDLRDAAPLVPGQRQGVAVGWSWGHWVNLLGGRPVVTNGFGTYLDHDSFWEMENALQGTPQQLEAAMRRHDLGYLVAGPLTLQKNESERPTTEGDLPFAAGLIDGSYMKEKPLGTLTMAGSGMPAMDVPHLEHFLPRFASRQVVAGIRFQLPAVWGFEFVEGARLAGAAPPGSRVVAELPFRENRRAHRWKAWADAGPDGTFSMTVPIPSGWIRPTLSTGNAWEVRVGDGEPIHVAVSEAAVRGGETVLVVGLPPPRGAKQPAVTVRVRGEPAD